MLNKENGGKMNLILKSALTKVKFVEPVDTQLPHSATEVLLGQTKRKEEERKKTETEELKAVAFFVCAMNCC